MLLLFLIYAIHSLLQVFLAFGFLLPKKYLMYYIFCWPTMLLCWKTNNDKCFITEWENKLNNDHSDKTVYETWSIVLHMSPAHTEWFLIGGTTFLWFIAMARYFM